MNTDRGAPDGVNISRIDPRLLKNLPVDLRVVLAWSADQRTRPAGRGSGGQLAVPSGSVTIRRRIPVNYMGGYGPEEFVLRQAKPALPLHRAVRLGPPAGRRRCRRWPVAGHPQFRHCETERTDPYQPSASASKPWWELVIPPDNAAP
jgi:hypothetical protein